MQDKVKRLYEETHAWTGRLRQWNYGISIFSSPLNHKEWYKVCHVQRIAHYDKKLCSFQGIVHCIVYEERKALYPDRFWRCRSRLAITLIDNLYPDTVL